MSRINFVLSRVEYEIGFITAGPGKAKFFYKKLIHLFACLVIFHAYVVRW